jgi:hypothetical protein
MVESRDAAFMLSGISHKYRTSEHNSIRYSSRARCHTEESAYSIPLISNRYKAPPPSGLTSTHEKSALSKKGISLLNTLSPIWPRAVPALHGEAKLSAITDEDFKASFAPVPVTRLQRVFQVISFLVFFGWLRIVLVFIANLVFVLLFLPLLFLGKRFAFWQKVAMPLGQLYAVHSSSSSAYTGSG